jgi:hypothetical protein
MQTAEASVVPKLVVHSPVQIPNPHAPGAPALMRCQTAATHAFIAARICRILFLVPIYDLMQRQLKGKLSVLLAIMLTSYLFECGKPPFEYRTCI